MSRSAELLRSRAEVVKLARLLGCDPARLAYLEPLPPGDVRRLRDAVTATLYDAHAGSLRRLAAASRLLPTALTATLAQRAFGPLLSARLAGLLDLDRAIDVAARLPPDFLADIAGELDPRRAHELIAGISPELIGQITAELSQRGDHVTMGRFVGHLGDEAIRAALEVLDDATLLRVAFVLDDRDQLGHLLAMLRPERARGLVAAAAAEDLWVEALDLLHHLSAAQRAEMAAATLALDGPALDAAIAAVLEHDLWDEVQLVAQDEPALQARLASQLAELPARRRRAVARQARAALDLDRLGVLGQALAAA